MATIEVRTQAELDAAISAAKPRDIIAIRGSGYFDLSDSATVTAYGSATVRAYDSATVWASDSATVTASDSATVTASGSATVTASRYVAIHCAASGRDRLTITGGVVIETPDVIDATTWVDYHGSATSDGMLVVFKALDDDWSTDNARRRGIGYAPGTEVVEAPDWEPTAECGRGLHASASPHEATRYNDAATRWVRCLARLDEVVVIDATKLKAPRLYGPFVAVDIHGDPIATPVPALKAKRTRKAATA